MPSKNRLTPSKAKVVASAWLAHASDQKIMINGKSSTCTKRIHYLPASGIHERVGEQEY